MKNALPLSLLLAHFYCANGHAQLVSNFVREQVGTLPKGRIMVSLVGLESGIGKIYNETGAIDAIQNNFNQSVTFSQIAADDPVRQNLLNGLFQAYGVPNGASGGSLQGVLEGRVSGKVPVLGYGIQDDFGVYVSVPVITFQMNTAYRFVPSAEMQAFLSNLEANGQVSTANEFREALNTSLESQISKFGYTYDPTLNRTVLGDVQVTFLHVLDPVGINDPGYAFQYLFVLPTAQDQRLDDLYGLRAGDRRLGIGARALGETPLFSPRFRLNGSAQFIGLFSAVQNRRFPSSSFDQLFELSNPNTDVQGGHRIQLQGQMRYEALSLLSFTTGLSYVERMRETYVSDIGTLQALDRASERSHLRLLSAHFGAEITTIPSFLAGNFIFPATFQVGVGIPLSGKNALAEPAFQFQGAMFF